VSFGASNPFPFWLGGDPSPLEEIHDALRANLGVDGCGPEDGIEDNWLWCLAEAIDADQAAPERAALQAFPLTATDHLPVYEQRFGLPSVGTDQDRRLAIDAFQNSEAIDDIPDLTVALLAISPHLGLQFNTRNQSMLTDAGKTLAPRGAGFPPYGGRVASDFVNYADEYVLHITWDTVAAGALPNDGIVRAVADLMTRSLAAWEDWQLHQLADGFFLDGGADGLSVMDFTAFGVP